MSKATNLNNLINLAIEHIRNNALDYAPLQAEDWQLGSLWILAENPNSMAADNYSLWLGERKIGRINLVS